VYNVFSVLALLLGLGFVIIDMEYAKRNKLSPRWIVDKPRKKEVRIEELV